MKNNKGEACSNKAADGFYVEGVAVCKTHFGNHAVAMMQAEIDAKSPPKEPLPMVELIPCKCKTKEGTKDEKPCQNKAKNDPIYDGMCPAHYNAHMKKLAKEAEPPKDKVERFPCKHIIKEGSKKCTQLEVDNCEGYCKRHYNLKYKVENVKNKTAEDSNKKVSEIETLKATVMAAMTALAALEAAKADNTSIGEDKEVAVEIKKKKTRKTKPKAPTKETYENVVNDLNDENSNLLNKEIPALAGVDISKPDSDNPFVEVELPDEY
jgi:hypothetical protein